MGGGDKRIVCAAVAKGEMIFEFIRKKGKLKGKKKGGNGTVSGAGFLSLHSRPPFPPSPSSEGLGLKWGRGNKI